MCYFDHVIQTDDEALLNENINLNVLQRALDARISMLAERTEASFKQALRSTDPSALSIVDQQIDLLQSMCVDAECLKNLGRSASCVRLDGILDDFTSMRFTLAKTMALLAAVNCSNLQSHSKVQPAYHC